MFGARGSGLTPAHDLRGGGALSKPSWAGWGLFPSHKPMAAPCQIHAVVRRLWGTNRVHR